MGGLGGGTIGGDCIPGLGIRGYMPPGAIPGEGVMNGEGVRGLIGVVGPLGP
jgi:hypothetical protein